MPAYDLLQTTRIAAIINELEDIRQVSRDYRWTIGNGQEALGSAPGSPRVPTRNIEDGEIFLRLTDRVTIAPIIPLDSPAPLRANNPVRLSQTTVPKIKHGMALGEEQLDMLDRIEHNLAGVEAQNSRDAEAFNNYLIYSMMDLLDGVKARVEHLTVGMLMDTYVYEENGMKLNISWGMPSDLKATAAINWMTGTPLVNNASATPVTDIQTLINNTAQKYGIRYNRASMSRQAFLAMVSSTEFRNLAPLYAQFFFNAVGTASVPVNDFNRMRSFAQDMLSLEIEFDDRQVQRETLAGDSFVAPPGTPDANQFLRFQPANKVILTCKESDGDFMTWDFANARLQETRAGLASGIIGGFEGMNNSFGPVGYAASASPTADPPGLRLFAAQRGFPRKKGLASSAVLTVF